MGSNFLSGPYKLHPMDLLCESEALKKQLCTNIEVRNKKMFFFKKRHFARTFARISNYFKKLCLIRQKEHVKEE
jgi:hypothetical protein